ncbi:MAG: signal recognition particle protein [Paracoccus sp. (in: a-proteobacteria)]|jgi:signal recognition particle subunit SRP54|uniref:signal recognition particle protein n=1 Tax=unclassified Paracoccus (in: a-proteobacteria) TaxID=2688777 RepID=UPI000C3DE16B|nr:MULTISPECIES: signal recognition particle protein [unclassified Paracoccus (in: a-proteobacteria)]MAL27017.1 signal recognition particle protein [Croceicoccus sp.]MBA49501.1 signal recognition particle protein [Paracoccus sp. (in: a-proteobacteria)]MCS5601052.1 signal recognition particle protein [Paracoccus sp. (in: a-proteobacteria)]|tara:strand:+ start:141 stop:1637 length:1497 start_codon:yes stop_codon:yes gene_type:complete
MFENLSDRLGGVFDRLTKQGALSEEDVTAAMREVRVALLEADVSLPVARSFVKSITAKATGSAVTKSVTPGQQVVKIVHDELIRVLQGEDAPEALRIDNPPAPILMVGLQGSGKTTTTAKLAKRLKDREKKRVLMASLDTNRPAAMEQLAILGQQIGVDTLPIVPGQTAVQIAQRAKQQASLGGYDVYMLDTAGRLHIDQVLMDEVQAVRDIAAPRETLLVVDGLTGQDAVNVATEFDGKVGVSGVVLTRMDGDGRGGAALSMRAVTGKPIRFVGLGEKMDALEAFDAQRIAGRILGMGDIVALVEKAQEVLEVEQAERMMKRFQKGLFNMNDLKGQLEQMQKMGGMQSIMGMMPGMQKMARQAEAAGMDDTAMRRQVALINSMTKKERANPALLQASRKKRIAAGAGLDVAELNRLLKMQRQMADTMKKIGKMGKGGMLKQAMRAMTGKGGGLPEMGDVDPARMAEATKLLQDPKGLGGDLSKAGLPGGFGGMFGKK